jgi:hypothetical protein
MDYTPISMRRVLVAFGLTAFVALLPVGLLIVKMGADGPLAPIAAADGSPRDMLLVLGSIAASIGVFVLVILTGRRVMRRPARA